jgi:hypothetical protein
MTEPRTTSPAPTPHALPLAAVLLLVLSAAITVFWFFVARGYWEDDAYIHLEFARSLAAGHGFRFDGHLVYGDTSPLWVALLVLFHLPFPDTVPGWIEAGKLLTVVAAAFSLSGVFFFARSLVATGVRHVLAPAQASLFAAFMVLGFVLSPYFGYWAFSGMEALAAAGLAAWICVLLARHRHSWKRLLLAALLLGLGPLLRPEMAFLAVLLAVVLFQRIRHLRASLTLRVDLLVGCLALGVAPAAAWAFYALHTFGSALPNTNAAKRAGPTDSVATRLAHLLLFGYPVAALACALLAAWGLWYLLHGRKSNAGPVWNRLPVTGWVVLLWTAISCIFYIANHTFVQTRYVFVTGPLLTVVLLALAALRWPRVYRGLLALALLFGAYVSVFTTLPLVRNKVMIDRAFAELAAFMNTLPDRTPVALYAIGEPAFLSGHPVVDTGGITRPGVVPFLFDPTLDRVTAWAREQGAQYQVIDHTPLPGARLLWSHDLPVSGWYLDPRRYCATERLQLWQLVPASAK